MQYLGVEMIESQLLIYPLSSLHGPQQQMWDIVLTDEKWKAIQWLLGVPGEDCHGAGGSFKR